MVLAIFRLITQHHQVPGHTTRDTVGGEMLSSVSRASQELRNYTEQQYIIQ